MLTGGGGGQLQPGQRKGSKSSSKPKSGQKIADKTNGFSRHEPDVRQVAGLRNTATW